MTIKEELTARADAVEKGLKRFFPYDWLVPQVLLQAMEYSLFAGGKRLRPILLLAANELLDGDTEEALPLACAIEMIHTYSLIHDDLPAMDNDDWRRGKLTNHKVYGEAKAILAGDALLNQAFELMLMNASQYPSHAVYHMEAMRTIAEGAGIRGMIGGQVLDVENEGNSADEKILLEIHRCKTGALITAALTAGLALNNPTRRQKEAIEAYGQRLGLAFQIMDDILDETGEQHKLGKKPGSDAALSKSTFPSLYGINDSKRQVERLTNEAVSVMGIFGSEGRFLKELAVYLGHRDH